MPTGFAPVKPASIANLSSTLLKSSASSRVTSPFFCGESIRYALPDGTDTRGVLELRDASYNIIVNGVIPIATHDSSADVRDLRRSVVHPAHNELHRRAIVESDRDLKATVSPWVYNPI